MKKIVNCYHILSVDSSTPDSEIKKAYLNLARKYHPDKNRGNKLAEKKFSQINDAYQILKDPKKRKKLDLSLEVVASTPSLHTFKSKPPAAKKKAPPLQEKKLDLEIEFPISIEDLCQKRTCLLSYFQPHAGTKRKMSLEVQIPPSASQGTRLLFKNKGGTQGRKSFGDLYIKLKIKSHTLFKIKDQNIYFDLPVAFVDALIGKELKIPTPYGEALLKIPKNTKKGTLLKLNGMGLPKTDRLPQGSLFVKILLDYPTEEKIKISNALKNLTGRSLEAFLMKYKNKRYIYPKQNAYNIIYRNLKNEK